MENTVSKTSLIDSLFLNRNRSNKKIPGKANRLLVVKKIPAKAVLNDWLATTKDVEVQHASTLAVFEKPAQ